MQPTTDPSTRNHLQRVFLAVAVCSIAVLASLYLSAGQAATAADTAGGPPPGPSVQAHKLASASLVAGGQTFSYTIRLKNMSNVDASVTVTDPLPMHVAYVADSATANGAYDPATHTLSWSAFTVTANSEVRLVFAVTADTVQVHTTVLNVAKIRVGNFVFQAPAWVTIVPTGSITSNLSRSFKIAARPVVAPGSPVTYTIKLINSSPFSTTATVTDPVPALLSYVPGSATGGGAYDVGSQTVSWSDVAVPPFGHVALSFAALAPNGVVTPTVVTNVATISSGAQSFERRAIVVIFDRPAPPPRPFLAGSFKAASERIVAAGEGFTYTIKLINSGTADAIVDVTDPLADELTYVFDSASHGGLFDPALNSLAWNAITVPAGTSVPLTFGVTATSDLTRPMLLGNTATITVANPVTTTNTAVFKRHAVVWLVPSVPSGDRKPPVVHSLTIGEQDVLTSPTVTLHISATDNVSVSQMFIREWQLTSSPHPHWELIQSSDWVPYQADYDWQLGSQNGTHFVGVWVKDAAGNVSHRDRRAFDFASLVLPGATVAERGVVPYLVYYPQGISVTAVLTSTTGDADLYVWKPGNHFWPDFKSTHPVSGTDVISFTTPRAGVYLFVVRGYTAATYDLSIEPGGGPRALWPWASAEWTSSGVDLNTPTTTAPSAKTDDLTYDALLPDSGVDPLADVLDPSAASVFLPMVIR